MHTLYHSFMQEMPAIRVLKYFSLLHKTAVFHTLSKPFFIKCVPYSFTVCQFSQHSEILNQFFTCSAELMYASQSRAPGAFHDLVMHRQSPASPFTLRRSITLNSGSYFCPASHIPCTKPHPRS